MVNFKRIILAVVAVLTSAAVVLAQETPTAFIGATLYPISGEPIENGVIIIQNGKISAIGDASTPIPANAERIDVTDKVIMPGLVDTHSHIGGGDGGDRSSALHPDVRIVDAIDVRSDTFRKARTGGVTTANVMPGSGHLLSGQTVYLKLRNADTIYDMLVESDITGGMIGGIKMANGTNSLRDSPFPGTRARSAAMMRDLFVRAQHYQQQIQRADGDPDKLPARNLQLEAMVQVLDGTRLVHFHTHRHDDILTILRLRDEFGFRVVLHHVSEAWKVADEIAAAGVPSSIILLDSPGGKLEAMNIRFENGKALEDAGADVAFHTDDSVTDSRLFLRMAAFGVRAGMSREKALEALTLAGARMLDMEDRIGSLEPGKDADIIVLDGDPFSVYTFVQQTWIDGLKVYDRTEPDQRKYSTGGYEVFRGEFFDHYSN
ncbi:MAG: amidohydrolase family protein [Balneolales bacterium]|nr:amidohydrolase family protein [Balneolales bacterium]